MAVLSIFGVLISNKLSKSRYSGELGSLTLSLTLLEARCEGRKVDPENLDPS